MASSTGMASAPDAHSRTEREVARLRARLDHHPVHGRHADEDRWPSALDGVERGRRAGTFAAGRPARRAPPAARASRTRRCGRPACRVTASSRRKPRREQRAATGLPDQRPVRELGALGLPGRARRVEERGDVAGRRGRAPRPARRRSSSAVSRTTMAASESATTWSTSSSRIFGLTGTATAPARLAADAQQHEGVAVGRRDHDAVAGRDLGLNGAGPNARRDRRPRCSSGAARRRRPPRPARRRRAHARVARRAFPM